MTDTKEQKQDDLSADKVALYLRENPGFFDEHGAVLENLLPRHLSKDRRVVDLRSVMIDKHRSENSLLKATQEEIMETGAHNFTILSRIHTAVLTLLEARELEQFIHLLNTDLPTVLDVDHVRLVVEDGAQPGLEGLEEGVSFVIPGQIDYWLGPHHICLHNYITAEGEIFGDAAKSIRSQALIRLDIGEDVPGGMLAIGSHDPNLFQPGQGSELVEFLCHVIERCIHNWVEWDPHEQE